MDNHTRLEIADVLEKLAEQDTWNDTVWQHCFDIVSANVDDELVAYAHDDIIHYSGTSLIFRRHLDPRSGEMQSYREVFRAVAAGLRSGMSLKQVREQYGI